jgi:hypothetical protein
MLVRGMGFMIKEGWFVGSNVGKPETGKPDCRVSGVGGSVIGGSKRRTTSPEPVFSSFRSFNLPQSAPVTSLAFYFIEFF